MSPAQHHLYDRAQRVGLVIDNEQYAPGKRRYSITVPGATTRFLMQDLKRAEAFVEGYGVALNLAMRKFEEIRKLVSL